MSIEQAAPEITFRHLKGCDMRRTAALGMIVATALLSLTACGSPAPAPTSQAPTPEPGAASAPPTRDPSTSPSHSAEPAGLDGTVSYSDGVEVRLVSDETRTIDETGAGAITGQLARTITVELTNGSSRPLDLNRVDVTLQVGGTNADPYPAGDAQTFAGTAKPGATATGTYAFLVPSGDTNTVTVDFDDQYEAAVFKA